MIRRIATVAVYVEDQQKAKQFWIERVGFDVVAEHPMGPDAFWLEVAPKGAQTALVIYPKDLMKDAETKRASIVFECDNVFTTYEEMKARGVQFLSEPQQMQWGSFVQFQDEDGNEFVLKS